MFIIVLINTFLFCSYSVGWKRSNQIWFSSELRLQVLAPETQVVHHVLPASKSNARLRAMELTNTPGAKRRRETADAECQGAVRLSAAGTKYANTIQLRA